MKKTVSILMTIMMSVAMIFSVDLSAYAKDIQFQELSVNSSISFNSTEFIGRKYFSVTLPTTGKITLSLSSSQFSGFRGEYFNIYYTNEYGYGQYTGKKFEYNSALGYFNNSAVEFTLMQGTYYFSVDNLSATSKSIDYTLSCIFIPSAESFPESLSGKREQFLSDANYISTDIRYYGQISYMSQENDYDIYAYNLTTGKLWVDFVVADNSTYSTQFTTYTLYDSDGNYLDNYDSVNKCYTINKAGMYYLKVGGGVGDYSFLITQIDYSAIQSKVTGLKASKKNPTSIKLAWSKKAGATGYEVQKYNGKKWTTYKTIKSNTNSVTVTKLKPLTEYKFRVRAYTVVNGQKITSAYSSALKAATTSEKVTNVKLKLSVNNKKKKASETISWKPQKGVSGYQIQLGEDERGYGGKGQYWRKKVTVKGASKKKYTIKVTYASGDLYTCVRIRPYKTVNGKKIYGQWSKIVYFYR